MIKNKFDPFAQFSQGLSQRVKTKEKSLPITAVLALFTGSFAFLYIGGWKVWLMAYAGGLLGRFSLYLPFEFMGDSPSDFPLMKHVLIQLMESIVFLWNAITYCSLYNKTIHASQNIKELRSFKAGRACFLLVAPGVYAANLGTVVFWDITTSEKLGVWALPMAIIATCLALYFINLWSRRVLID